MADAERPLSAREGASIRAAAWRVLRQNRRRGFDEALGRDFDFVCPSLDSYPFQWFWDSCFHAIALTHFDVALACRELQGLLDAAEPSGFLPHIVFWDKERFAPALARYNVVFRTSRITATIQPPVLALALERVAAAGAPTDWLRAALPPTVAYYRWLADARDPDGDGLIAILQPDESGLDSAPQYDAVLGLGGTNEAALGAAMHRLFAAYGPERQDDRRLLALDVFHVEDVLVNVIWIEALRALARLLARVETRGLASLLPTGQGAGAAASHPVYFAQLADRARASLLSRCYDPGDGAFYDAVGHAERPARVLTVSSLMPLFLSDLPHPVATRLVDEHLLQSDRFWLPYPVPSVAASEPSFEPDFRSGLVWRGPTWINTNWFLVQGLRRHGFAALADRLAERTARLVLRSGLRECYNPFTAEGYGARDFAWSALVVDLLPGGATGGRATGSW